MLGNRKGGKPSTEKRIGYEGYGRCMKSGLAIVGFEHHLGTFVTYLEKKMKYYYLLFVFCVLRFSDAGAQPYLFELSKTIYSPMDTNKSQETFHGYHSWANSVNSVQIDLPFTFPYLSKRHETIYYTTSGSIMMRSGAALDDRIELFNTYNQLADDSYISYRFNTGGDVSFLHMEYSRMRLDTDTSIYFSFQSKLYEDGTIEVIVGPNNLNYKLKPDSAIYVGLDSSMFQWTYFLTGNPNNPGVIEGNPDTNLLEIAKPGTVYRFKVDDGSSLSANGETQLELYPNPATDQVIIENPDLVYSNLRIVNTSGKVLFDRLISQSEKVTVPTHWPLGVYFVELSNETHIVKSKLLVGR